MSEQEVKNNIKNDNNTETSSSVKTDSSNMAPSRSPRSRNTPKREFKKNKRKPSKRRERTKPEFDQRMLSIRRVTRVSSGGRRFSFSVSMVIGDGKGKSGVGIGKAGDTTLAIDKAVRNARKNMITINRTKNNSIKHEVSAKYNSARVIIMPAKGRGMIAGSALRDLLELAGITDVNAKVLSGSKNKLNIAKATVEALKTLKN
jgi:small subunit ribosomal protein S5